MNDKKLFDDLGENVTYIACATVIVTLEISTAVVAGFIDMLFMKTVVYMDKIFPLIAVYVGIVILALNICSFAIALFGVYLSYKKCELKHIETVVTYQVLLLAVYIILGLAYLITVLIV